MTNPAVPLMPLPAVLPQALTAPDRTPPPTQSAAAAPLANLFSRGQSARHAARRGASGVDTDDAPVAADILDVSDSEERDLPLLQVAGPENLSARLSNWPRTDNDGVIPSVLELAILLATQPPSRGYLALRYQEERGSAPQPAPPSWSLAFDLECEGLGLVQIRLILMERLVIGTLTFSDSERAAAVQARLSDLETRVSAGGALERPVLRIRVMPEAFVDYRSGAHASEPGGVPDHYPEAGLQALGEIVRFLLDLRGNLNG